jgi:aspartyl/glutamyl-tRNA(Asn/Gln) amidotransferase C subunit
LGWSPSDEKIKFTLSELVSAFDIKGISKYPSIFDYKNLKSLNGSYLRALNDVEFYFAVLPYIKEGVKREIDFVYAAQVLKERCDLLSEIPEQLDFIDTLPGYSIDLYKNKKMNTNSENSKETLTQILAVLENENEWTEESVRNAVLTLANRLGKKNGQVLWPLRVALTGKMFTPGGGIETCILLGRAESLIRIKKAIVMLEETKETQQCNILTPKEKKHDLPAQTQESTKPAEKTDTKPKKPAAMPQADIAVNRIARPLTDAAEMNRIAEIAKLNISEHINEFEKDFRSVLTMLDVLKQIECDTAQYPLNMDIVNVFRDDINDIVLTRDEALTQRSRFLSVAPSVEAGCVSVPKILGKEE